MSCASFNEHELISDELIENCLDEFPTRTKEILYSRFGLKGAPNTVREIGNKYNISIQAVYQICEKAIRQLRSHTRIASVFEPFSTSIITIIKENGGVIAERDLVNSLCQRVQVERLNPSGIIKLVAIVRGASGYNWNRKDSLYSLFPVKQIKTTREPDLLPLKLIHCQICEAAFDTKHNLMLHLYKQHMPKNAKSPYECPVCGKIYGYVHRYWLAMHWFEEHFSKH